jgi:hypothetical protein
LEKSADHLRKTIVLDNFFDDQVRVNPRATAFFEACLFMQELNIREVTEIVFGGIPHGSVIAEMLPDCGILHRLFWDFRFKWEKL